MEHWIELPKSSQRVGGVRIWTKRSRPWRVHSLKQFTWTNRSSPTPAGLERNKHRTKLVPLNVGDSRSRLRSHWWWPQELFPLYWLFGILFSLEGYLVQPRYSREGLGPSSKQCALLFVGNVTPVPDTSISKESGMFGWIVPFNPPPLGVTSV